MMRLGLRMAACCTRKQGDRISLPRAMSGENSASNNWTILTPEESAAETLRPLAEGTEHHEPDSGASQTAGGEASSNRSPVEEHMVSSSSVSVSDAHKLTEGLPEGPAQSSSDPESFSDSYTHITPSSDEASELQPSTETLRGEHFDPEEQRQLEEEALSSHDEDRLQKEDDKSATSSKIPTSAKQEEETSERPEKGEDPELRRRKTLLASLEEIGTKLEEEREQFQVPQREEDGGITLNKCIICAVILLGLGTIFISEGDFGKREVPDSEAPGKQEWFSKEAPPPPADADATEPLSHLPKGNEQISVLQAQLQAQNEELKVAKEQIADGAKERLLWEEMGEENSRLKTQAASLSLLQNENERMTRELESVRSLQQEVETLRSTVTELKRSSASEAARPPVNTATSPFSGQAENSRQDTSARKLWSNQREKKEKYDTGENKPWKGGEKSERQEGEKKKHKEGDKKEEKYEQRRSDKVKDGEEKQKRQDGETERWKKNESKKDKKGRGDEGKPWKDRSERREETEKSERKNHKDVKDWRKGKHEKVKEGEQEGWKRAKDHREKHGVREDRKEEKEWRKVHGGIKESDKEKWEKDWKKGEKKGWKKDGEWSDKSGKDGGKEQKHQGERKQSEGSENHSKRHNFERDRKDERKHWEKDEWTSNEGKDRKERKRKDEGNQWEKKKENGKRGQEEMGHSEDRKKDSSSSQKHKDRKMQKMSGVDHQEESLWTKDSAHKSHRRPSLGQPEYWAQQRERLLHSPTPPQNCETPEACATTDGLLPVPYAEFDAVLQKYIAKAEEAGVEAYKREELKKLAAEFFKDGIFAHDQMNFHDFVDDLEDILEDMVEEDDNGQEEDSVLEEEMEEFEREVLRKFSVAKGAKKEGRIKEELKKESGRGRG
ncbi:pre-B-cell leukemia homeobox interacting protein 1b isoform X2 [Cynoglossus semilaevis]|nr:pre-B-cell leukemia transcription factor-interacting protein 1 isoform X2 [Cynoglossus semilaevis]